MKKRYLLLFFTLFFASSQIVAQLPFNTTDSLAINNIHATVLVHGDLWWDPATQSSHCILQPRHFAINYAGSIWMSGYDAGNALHVSAQTYRQEGVEFWPGPLDPSGSLSYTMSRDWAKIWKINRWEIQYFCALTSHTLGNTPTAILTWPAKGNTFSKGNAGVPLNVVNDMAPFVDVNGNGIYEPLSGDYPDVPGDQAIWWVFSDNGPTHSVTHGMPLGMEVHSMAYAYNRGSLIDNVIYYDYVLVNRSANNYHGFRLAQWSDVEIGNRFNDYAGFDSTWRMGIGYNKGNSDTSVDHVYKLYPPQSAVTMIVQPADTSGYAPAGNYMVFNNDASIIGNPSNDTQYNHYMHGKWINGRQFDSGFFCCIPGSKYIYPGDPSDANAWSECTCMNSPADIRFVLTSDNLNLNSGSTAHFVFALIAVDSAGGCNTSFNNLRILADTAWNIYHHPLSPLIYPGKNYAAQVLIYPNPAHHYLYIEDKVNNMDNVSVTFYNVLGQKLLTQLNKYGQKCELDVSSFPSGFYSILYRNDNIQLNAKFIKQ